MNACDELTHTYCSPLSSFMGETEYDEHDVKYSQTQTRVEIHFHQGSFGHIQNVNVAEY